MTCKEKLKQEHPNAIDNRYYAECAHCPSTYNYDVQPLCGNDLHNANKETCTACWNQELPENIADLVTIKDSGDRTEFATGAVRDMREGKGRCDLMPLDVVGAYYKVVNDGTHENIYWVFHDINRFHDTNDVYHLYRALERFDGYSEHETMFLEVAKHFEEGAKKYGETNWKKGIPVHCYIDSAVRHYLKWLRGDKDEPHDRAFVWNILCCIWTCENKPELNTYGKEQEQ